MLTNILFNDYSSKINKKYKAPKQFNLNSDEKECHKLILSLSNLGPLLNTNQLFLPKPIANKL
jgi:hypothetical protein